MFGLGMPELVVILIIILVLFGASKLPKIGKGMGEAIRNFRKTTSELDNIDISVEKVLENRRTIEAEPSKKV